MFTLITTIKCLDSKISKCPVIPDYSRGIPVYLIFFIFIVQIEFLDSYDVITT